LNYGYLLLVVPGFLLTMAGFMGVSRKRRALLSGLMFVAGICVLVLGILLTCVPDFFSG
jgi:hypothetical protein